MKKIIFCAVAIVLTLTTGVTDGSAATPRQRLANVAVPAYCHMPAQRLHHGTTARKYRPAQGSIEFDYLASPISVHLRKHGTQLLAQYGCTAGGVGWPSVLVLYDKHNALISSLRLDHYAKAEHSQVDKWSVAGHDVHLSWSSYEGAGFDIHHHRSTLSLRHGGLRMR